MIIVKFTIFASVFVPSLETLFPEGGGGGGERERERGREREERC